MHKITQDYRDELKSGITQDYMGLQHITQGYIRLHPILQDYLILPEITDDCLKLRAELQKIKWDYAKIQRTT